MNLFIDVAHYAFSIIITISFVFLMGGLMERPIESMLVGKPKWGAHFFTGYFRRVWAYVVLPLVFSFTGVGLVLFPNTNVQNAWAQITTEMLDKEGPYSATIIEQLHLQQGTVAILSAIIIAIVLIALVRIFAVNYNPAIASIVYFNFLGALAIMALMLQVDFSGKFIRILIDYLVGEKFVTGIILFGVGSVVGLFTEGILARLPIIGMGVGQRPGQGSYVCKSCQSMQYLDNENSALAPCQHGRCEQSVFRKLS